MCNDYEFLVKMPLFPKLCMLSFFSRNAYTNMISPIHFISLHCIKSQVIHFMIIIMMLQRILFHLIESIIEMYNNNNNREADRN